jgi:hypothetical protein
VILTATDLQMTRIEMGVKLGYGCVQLNNKPLGFGGNFP